MEDDIWNPKLDIKKCPICGKIRSKSISKLSSSPEYNSPIPLPCSQCFQRFRRRKSSHYSKYWGRKATDLTPIEEALTSEENNNSTTSLSDCEMHTSMSGDSCTSDPNCSNSEGEEISSSNVVQCIPSNIKIVVTSSSQEDLLEQGRKIDVWVKDETNLTEHENGLDDKVQQSDMVASDIQFLYTTDLTDVNELTEVKLDDDKVECDFCVTENQISLQDFVLHLKDVHSIPGFEKEQKYFEFKTGCNDEGFFESDGFLHSPQYMFCHGKYFLSQGCTKDGKYHGWISIIGSTDEAKTYKATVFTIAPSTMGLFQKKVPELRWTLPVQAFGDTRQAYSYTMSWNQLKPYLVKNTKLRNGCKVKFAWSVKISIARIKS